MQMGFDTSFDEEELFLGIGDLLGTDDFDFPGGFDNTSFTPASSGNQETEDSSTSEIIEDSKGKTSKSPSSVAKKTNRKKSTTTKKNQLEKAASSVSIATRKKAPVPTAYQNRAQYSTANPYPSSDQYGNYPGTQNASYNSYPSSYEPQQQPTNISSSYNTMPSSSNPNVQSEQNYNGNNPQSMAYGYGNPYPQRRVAYVSAGGPPPSRGGYNRETVKTASPTYQPPYERSHEGRYAPYPTQRRGGYPQRGQMRMSGGDPNVHMRQNPGGYPQYYAKNPNEQPQDPMRISNNQQIPMQNNYPQGYESMSSNSSQDSRNNTASGVMQYIRENFVEASSRIKGSHSEFYPQVSQNGPTSQQGNQKQANPQQINLTQGTPVSLGNPQQGNSQQVKSQQGKSPQSNPPSSQVNPSSQINPNQPRNTQNLTPGNPPQKGNSPSGNQQGSLNTSRQGYGDSQSVPVGSNTGNTNPQSSQPQSHSPPRVYSTNQSLGNSSQYQYYSQQYRGGGVQDGSKMQEYGNPSYAPSFVPEYYKNQHSSGFMSAPMKQTSYSMSQNLMLNQIAGGPRPNGGPESQVAPVYQSPYYISNTRRNTPNQGPYPSTTSQPYPSTATQPYPSTGKQTQNGSEGGYPQSNNAGEGGYPQRMQYRAAPPSYPPSAAPYPTNINPNYNNMVPKYPPNYQFNTQTRQYYPDNPDSLLGNDTDGYL